MAKRDPKEAEEKRSEICAKSREANWHPERKAGIHHERLFSKIADPFGKMRDLYRIHVSLQEAIQEGIEGDTLPLL